MSAGGLLVGEIAARRALDATKHHAAFRNVRLPLAKREMFVKTQNGAAAGADGDYGTGHLFSTLTRILQEVILQRASNGATRVLRCRRHPQTSALMYSSMICCSG
jgi:hypothetical protein